MSRGCAYGDVEGIGWTGMDGYILRSSSSQLRWYLLDGSMYWSSPDTMVTCCGEDPQSQSNRYADIDGATTGPLAGSKQHGYSLRSIFTPSHHLYKPLWISSI